MNLIKMNFYRFFRMKLCYILLLISIALVIFVVIEGKTASVADKEAMNQYIAESAENGEESVNMKLYIYDDFSLNGVTSEIVSSQILLILMTIFVCCFINEERTMGYIKNLTACSDSKAKIYLSKVPVIAVYSAMLLGSVILGAIICQSTRLSCSLEVFVWFLVLQWMLHTGFGIFISMLAEVLRNQISVVVLGIAASVSIPTVILSEIMNKIPCLYDLRKYTHLLLSPLVKNLTVSDNINTFSLKLTVILSCLILSILSLFIGTMSIMKRDL